MADMAPGSVHCAVSSYPYFGLRSYLEVPPLAWGEWVGHWGLEPTFEMWVEHCVEVSRAVGRVLRDDGSFWLNIGSLYASTGKRGREGDGERRSRGAELLRGGVGAREDVRAGSVVGFKPKDLVMQGPLLAEALRQDGWFLRSHIIWSKRSVLPESVVDRPASSYEHVFLLTKSDRYFYDHAAVRVPYAEKSKPQVGTRYKGQNTKDRADRSQDASDTKRRVIASMEARGGRNLRNVWEEQDEAAKVLRAALTTRSVDLLSAAIGRLLARDPVLALLTEEPSEGIDGVWARVEEALALLDEPQPPGPTDVWWVNPMPLPGSHTAAFPEKLVETCIRAGTSERGACPLCGAQWGRLSSRNAEQPVVAGSEIDRYGTGDHGVHRKVGSAYQKWLDDHPLQTVGWEPGCACRNAAGEPYAPIRPTCLDPCGGSGTVGVVAERLGRDSILIELSPAYAEQARARIADPEWATKERRRQREAKRAKDVRARPAGTDGWASTQVQPDDGPSMGREDAERVMLAGYDDEEEGRA